MKFSDIFETTLIRYELVKPMQIECNGGDQRQRCQHLKHYLKYTAAPCLSNHICACLLAGNIGHRPRNAIVFCPWSTSPFLSWCIPSPLFLFPCLSARCFVAYLFASSLGVPRLTGDGFCWFPECMFYPPPFCLLYFIFLWVVAWSFSRVECWIPCLSI